MRKIVIGIFTIFITSTSFGLADNILNLGDFLTIYLEGSSDDIPSSWQYINVDYNNINKGSELYKSLQKGIYLDIFPNIDGDLPIDEYLTQEKVISLLKIKQNKKFDYKKGEKITKEWTLNMVENNKKIDVNINKTQTTNKIMEDIKKRLTEEYIYPDKMEKKNMEYGAIAGYIDAINDTYTVFFPPEDAKSFDDSLNGNFEGIGAYIDMVKPGMIVIESPIKDSPAEKYGAKAGDVILKVGENKVDKTTSIDELINWVKGPEGTYVNILVKRGHQEILLKIRRAKIILPNVEYELMEGGNCYISINQFNMQSKLQFREAINYFEDKNCSKYIFDVRNNPGGNLNDVGYMLNYFVPTGETAVVIKYKDDEGTMTASNRTTKLTDENVIVLTNGGSASASEIFAGVIKDYVKNSILLGTKTFGKGSVQSLIEYSDGSMLKYTIAKWYTGGSKKNIDLEGIKPDLELEDNIKTDMDDVLEVAKIYKFK